MFDLAVKQNAAKDPPHAKAAQLIAEALLPEARGDRVTKTVDLKQINDLLAKTLASGAQPAGQP